MLEIEIMKFEIQDIITASVPVPDTELKCTCNMGHSLCGRWEGGSDKGEAYHHNSCDCKLPSTAVHNFDK